MQLVAIYIIRPTEWFVSAQSYARNFLSNTPELQQQLYCFMYRVLKLYGVLKLCGKVASKFIASVCPFAILSVVSYITYT